MSLLSDIRERLRTLIFRAREDRELEEELRFHLDMAVEQNLRRGMSPREARRQAHLRLGGLTRVREATRDARGVRWLRQVAQDAGYGLRGLRANPVFTVALVLTLGLGVGASAAMFSVVDALLLRPFPFGEPDRLVEIHALDPETGRTSIYLASDVAEMWGERSDLFEATLRHTRASILFTGGAEPVTIPVQIVSPSFEETLLVRPVLGRGLDGADAYPGAEPVALLNHGFWRTALGADPDVLGRTIELDGIDHRVVGVMPEGFKFPTYSYTEVWVPLGEDGTALGARLTRPLETVARLSEGERIETAGARADALAASLSESAPREGSWRVRLEPFGDNRGGGPSLRRAVFFLAGAVGLILLVATLNGINLLLVRGWGRTRELAVRTALGASRGRLVVQLTTESLLLGLASGALAAGFALGALQLVRGIIPGSITFFAPYAFTVEERTLAFTFAIAVAAGLAIGLVPAVLSTRTLDGAAAGAISPHAARTPARSRLRRGLVVAEVAVSVALLIGAGLLVNSFVRLVRVDPGFRLDNVAVLSLSLSRSTYPTGEERMAFLRRLERRLEALPGVIGVTTGGGGIPASMFTEGGGLETQDGAVVGHGQPQMIPMAQVSPDFFELLEVGVVAGRPLTAGDLGTDNVLIDLDLARFLWGDANPVGRRFRVSEGWDWATVVGVVGDIQLEGPDDRASGDFEIIYPASSSAAGYSSLAIRTAGDPTALFLAIRAALAELDPRQPISDLQTARAQYAEEVDMPRFLLVLMSELSGLALLLATVGIYGVLAFAVAQRRFELAVRVALGARPGTLSRGVLREGLGLAGIGAAIGTLGALAMSGLIRGLLYGVEPDDPATLAVVAGVSLASAALACWWPARRATRVDPVEVLKAS